MDEQRSPDFFRRPFGQFLVDAVHRVARLEGHDLIVAQFR